MSPDQSDCVKVIVDVKVCNAVNHCCSFGGSCCDGEDSDVFAFFKDCDDFFVVRDVVCDIEYLVHH